MSLRRLYVSLVALAVLLGTLPAYAFLEDLCPQTVERLTAMNRALASYGDTVRKRSANPAKFVAFELMPGNATDPLDKSVCWK